ncbi:MAG: ferrochelatase [Deltaproteobacteria bacterium]|nr:ferrochelatase [Deltaproteobacteria bacterium]
MTGVILINFGGPRNGEEIRPFLKDLFKDVLPRPLKFLALILANLRTPYAKKMYDAIGSASPVVGWTIKQAVMLEAKLNTIAPPPHPSPSPARQRVSGGRGEGKGGGDARYKIYTGMKYGRPSISDAVAEAKEAGCEKIIMLPLFPYQSRYTSSHLPIFPSPQSWHIHPLYISVMVDIIRTALENWKNIPPPDITLLFSVHAIPLSSAKNEPYVRQIHESCAEIMKSFTGYNYQIVTLLSPTRGEGYIVNPYRFRM